MGIDRWGYYKRFHIKFNQKSRNNKAGGVKTKR